MVLIRNALLNQFTTYNYPIVAKITDFHAEYDSYFTYRNRALRIFERQFSMLEACQINNIKKGDTQFIEIREVSMEIKIYNILQDFTYVLLNYGPTS